MEGGSCNAYEYACGDPVNGFDLSGRGLFGIECGTCGDFVDAAQDLGSDFVDYVEGEEYVKAIDDPNYDNRFANNAMAFASATPTVLGVVSVFAPPIIAVPAGVGSAITGYAVRSSGSSACEGSQHAAGFAEDAIGFASTGLRAAAWRAGAFAWAVDKGAAATGLTSVRAGRTAKRC